MQEIKRIPYDQWINSQLSIARFYGSININWDTYTYDKDTMKQMAEDESNGVSDDKVYKPDLVLYK